MNTTAWVAVAGIAGTLLGPLLTERVHRKSTRTEQLRAERLRVYADLLRERGLIYMIGGRGTFVAAWLK